jgi:hypothetical protein
MKTQIKQLLYGILATSCFGLSCTSLTWAAEEYHWPPEDGEPIVTLLGPVYETGRETKVPLFKALEQAMTAIVENQQTHLPEFYQQHIAGMNHQLFRPGYSNEEEWGSIKSLSSKAEEYDTERMAGILESSENRKPGLEMAIRMQPTIDPQPASVMLEGYRFVLHPSGKGQAEWFTQEVKLKGRSPDDAFQNALIWQLSKPFEKAQKTFVLDDLDVPVWKDKNTAGVLTFADKQFTADAEPVRKETLKACVQTSFCPEMNVKGDEFALVSNIADAQVICDILGRELIDKEIHLRLSLTEEGSNLLDEENGAAWHTILSYFNGGEVGFFEENYNHLDFIPVIPSETAGIDQSGVVWCRSPVRDTFNFLPRPNYYVIDRGWRTIKLYKSNEVGFRILDEELVVEFLENDELYPLVKYGRILENSFSDAANQGDSVRDISPGPERMRGVGFESYPIDVILSGRDLYGVGWERKISNVPVRRFGAIWAYAISEIQFGKRVHAGFGLSSPGLDVNVINFDKAESVTGGGFAGFSDGCWPCQGYYANIGFGDYLKLLPNIGWNVSLGMERLNFRNSVGTDSGLGLLLLGLDARLLFQYKMVAFSLGQIIHSQNSGDFVADDEHSEPEPFTKKISIPAGTSLLMGLNFRY